MSACITPIEVLVSPGDSLVDTGILCPVTANYNFILEFNDTFQEGIIAGTYGSSFKIPNIVNGQYVHALEIYAPDNTLLNNTIYHLKIRTVISYSPLS